MGSGQDLTSMVFATKPTTDAVCLSRGGLGARVRQNTPDSNPSRENRSASPNRGLWLLGTTHMPMEQGMGGINAQCPHPTRRARPPWALPDPNRRGDNTPPTRCRPLPRGHGIISPNCFLLSPVQLEDGLDNLE